MKIAFLIPSTTKNRPWKKIEETYLYTVFGESFLNTLSDDIDYSIYINIDIDDPIYSKKEEKEKFERFIGEKAEIKWIDDGAKTRLINYKFLNEKEKFYFEFSSDQIKMRDDVFKRYGTDINALSKIVTRISSLESQFRKIRYNNEIYLRDIYTKVGEKFTRYALSG